MRALILSVVILAACADSATAPISHPALSAVPASQTTTVGASATLAATHVTTYSPAEYSLTVGPAIDGRIVDVEYAFTFGNDKLDGGECVYFYDEVSNGAYCNPPGAEPIASKILTFACDTAWNVCNSLEDGRSSGLYFVFAVDPTVEATLDLADLHVTVNYVTEHGVGPIVLIDQFGGLSGASLNGRRLPTGGGTWSVPYGSATLNEGVVRLKMGLDPGMADREECLASVPDENICYVYGAMTLMLDRSIGADHEIQISLRDFQPDQALGIWTMADPWPWYFGMYLWMDGNGVWAITGEGDVRVPTGEIQRGDYTLRIFDVDFVSHRYSLEVIGKLSGGGLMRGVKTGLDFGQSNMRALAITLQADPGKTRGTKIAGVRIVTR